MRGTCWWWVLVLVVIGHHHAPSPSLAGCMGVFWGLLFPVHNNPGRHNAEFNVPEGLPIVGEPPPPLDDKCMGHGALEARVRHSYLRDVSVFTFLEDDTALSSK